MRKIKVRAWHKVRKEMYEVYGLSRGFVFKDSLDGFGTPGNPDLIEHVELMQYTGLKDKNGIEIYEGDIMINEKTKEVSHIEYSNEHACFRAVAIHKDYKVSSAIINLVYHGDLRDMKVSGNIYKNPELLEAKK